MQKPLLRKPVRRTHGDGFLMAVAVIGLILASVAFYVALRGYLDDKQISFNTMLDCAVDNLQRASGIQDEITQDKASLDSQTAACEEALERINENEFDPQFISVYNQMNATIVAANETCNSQIEALTLTLMQIINATSVTPDLIGIGICEFTAINPSNETLPISKTQYQYKRLTLNGIEFYYYVFGASTEAPLLVEDGGARIENCSPIIFKGDSQPKPLFVDKRNTLTPSDYVREVNVGQNRLELLPDSMGGMYENQTLSINEGFQVWVNLF